MREKITLETPEFPNFLSTFIPLVSKFIANQHMKATPEKQYQFAKHLILEFYLRSNDPIQLKKDLTDLTNYSRPLLALPGGYLATPNT
jgi:hypothetical protein